MFERLGNWKDRRRERREAEEHRLRNTWVTCWSFRVWRRNALIGYSVLLLGLGGNSLVDRGRATDGREALAESGNVVSVSGCNRDFRLYQKVRAVFERGLAQIEEQHEQGLTTDAQYERSRSFYMEQLTNFALPDCRVVSQTLTDDPEKADGKVAPTPLYPGSPEAQPPFDANPNEGRARPSFGG
jgi:hypothetical protein